jgi:DNA repair exonuclease SbcCD ATPase subunit
LLLQLHQVQEELESQFLQSKEQLETLSAEKAALAKDKETLTRDKVTLTAARDEQSKLAVERGGELARLQERLNALEAQHTALETSRKQLEATRKQLETSHKELEATHKDTVEENELLLLQLHQVQEELEQYFLKYQELKGLQDELGAHTTTASDIDRISPKNPSPNLSHQAPDRRRSKRPPALKSGGLFGKNRKERRRLERYVTIIRESGLFDELGI